MSNMKMETRNFVWICVSFLCLLTSMVEHVECRSRSAGRGHERLQKSRHRGQRLNFLPPAGGSRKPNIILVLTDDQDVVLGSMAAMNKTRYYLGQRGADFTNAFVTTPMCCPSRASILTGQYVHNHQVYSNIGEYCGSDQWRMGPELANFGTYLQSASYRTGYFGKYLNEYRGDYIPPGWVEWVGLVKNSKFYNYTLCRNGQLMRHGFDYHRDYLPDLIANDSIAFFKLSKRAYPRLPVAMVMSFPSPHGPEDGAPQYQHMFQGNTLHRTPAWNYGPNDDKHWIVRQAGAMTKTDRDFTDALQRKRLITLMSVDDAVEKLCRELDAINELHNTYIIFTSDHGYHLGQFNMLKGKSNAYDTDIRVPFYIRGPDIPQGIRVPNIVLNIDLAPTMLDMAGVSIPPHMDGVSIMKLFQPETNYKVARKSRRWKYLGSEPWRDSFLVEKTRSPEEMNKYMKRASKPSKADVMEKECLAPELQGPCKWGQTKACVRDSDGSLHLRKCRIKQQQKCQCSPRPADAGISADTPLSMTRGLTGSRNGRGMTRYERRQQRKFLKRHTDRTSQQGNFKAKTFLVRGRRDLGEAVPINNEVIDINDVINNDVIDNIGLESMCEILENETIICDNEVFANKQAWKEHWKSVESQLRYLRRYMDKLKDIKTFLKEFRPEVDDGKTTSYDIDGLSSDDRDLIYEDLFDESSDSISPTINSEGPLEDLFPGTVGTNLGPASNSAEDITDERQGRIEVQGGLLEEEQEQEDLSSKFDRTRGKGSPDKGRDSQQNKDAKQEGEDPFAAEEECVCEEVDVVEMDDQDLEVEVPLIALNQDFIDLEEEEDDEDDAGDDNMREYIETPMVQLQRDDHNPNLVLSRAEKARATAKAKARAKKLKKKAIKNSKPCSMPGLSCFHHDNDHWKTAPYWTEGIVCACLNTLNNSYYCVRTINETHNFVYCEYVTNFREYFDMRPYADPYQLTNLAYMLDPDTRADLHDQIDELRTCRGRRCSPATNRRKTSRRPNGVSPAKSFWQSLPKSSRYQQ